MKTTCPVCQLHSHRGLGWFDPSKPINEREHFYTCSNECLGVIMQNKGAATERPVDEAKAIATASADAGQYLEALGKTDLMAMTPGEWQGLIDVVCASYADDMRKLIVTSHTIPF